jgi:hypothetical protein
MSTGYRHYEKSNQGQREKMVEHPALFIKTLNATRQDRAAQPQQATPEEQWLSTIQQAGRLLQRLTTPLHRLMDPATQNAPQIMLFEQHGSHLLDRYKQFEKSFQEALYAYRTTQRNHQGTACAQHQHQGHKPATKTLTQHGTKSPEAEDIQSPAVNPQVAAHELEVIRTVLSNTGQCGTDTTTASG